MNVKEHVEPSLSEFLNVVAGSGVDEASLMGFASDYTKGWDSAISFIVHFVKTSGEVPKLFRGIVSKKLEAARPTAGVIVAEVTDKPESGSEGYIAGWNAGVNYLLDFANGSKEVPAKFRAKLVEALSETRI